jgi:hypothetical protein
MLNLNLDLTLKQLAILEILAWQHGRDTAWKNPEVLDLSHKLIREVQRQQDTAMGGSAVLNHDFDPIRMGC